MTPQQLIAIKDDILADPVMSVLPQNSDSAFEIARLYNLPADPAWYVWRSNANVDDIYDAISWASMTPADVPADTDTVKHTNRALVCQAKQINLQILLQGRQTINATKLRVRQALTDSLQNVPAGANGSMLDAGWAAVKQCLYRPASRIEKLLSTGTGTTGVPATMGYEGSVSYQDIVNAFGA